MRTKLIFLIFFLKITSMDNILVLREKCVLLFIFWLLIIVNDDVDLLTRLKLRRRSFNAFMLLILNLEFHLGHIKERFWIIDCNWTFLILEILIFLINIWLVSFSYQIILGVCPSFFNALPERSPDGPLWWIWGQPLIHSSLSLLTDSDIFAGSLLDLISDIQNFLRFYLFFTLSIYNILDFNFLFIKHLRIVTILLFHSSIYNIFNLYSSHILSLIFHKYLLTIPIRIISALLHLSSIFPVI